jgi:hypothetical protein
MKAPEYIEIEMDGNFTSAVVSFGTGRKRRLTYKVLEKHTHLKTSITTIELERDIETDKPVKEPLTPIPHVDIKRLKGEHKGKETTGFFSKGKKLSRATPKTKDKTETAVKKPLTPREAAVKLIRSQVENGSTIQQIKQSQHCHCCKEYWANVGGYADQKRYPTDKIVVHAVNDKKIKPAAIFSLREIYNEIKKSSGAPDDGKKPVKEPLTVTAVKRKREILPGRVQTSANAHQYLDCKGCKLDTSIHPSGDEGQLCLKDWLVHGYPDPNNPVDTNVDYTYDKINKIYVKDD